MKKLDNKTSTFIKRSNIKVKRGTGCIIVSADLETYIGGTSNTELKHIPIYLGFKIFKKGNNVEIKHVDLDSKNIELESDIMIINFLVRLLNLKEKVIVYLHNMGAFDGILILNAINNSISKNKNLNLHLTKCIIRNSKIYEIRYKNITIRDSYNLLQQKLDTLSEKILNDKKLKIDYEIFKSLELIKKNDDLIKKYLKKDVILLEELIQKLETEIFTKYKISIHESLSLSGLAFKIFRSKYMLNENIYINKEKYIYDFLKESYHGGLTNVLIPEAEKVYHYDVNSLYPYSMLKDMPVDEPKNEIIQNLDITNFFGFIKCTIKIPNSLYLPPLPYKKDGNLILPTGIISGCWFSEEIINAVNNYNCEIISIEKAISFKKEKIFTEYVNDLYKEKIKGNKTIFKLLLNALYGRFGMNKELNVTKFIHKDDVYAHNLFYKIIQKYNVLAENNYQLISLQVPQNFEEEVYSSLNLKNSELKKIFTFINKHKIEKSQLNVSVQISSAIASYSRIKMINDINYLLKNGYKIYYFDTDSIFTDKPLPKDFTSKTEIGKYKLEGEYDNAKFFAPKAYMTYTNNIKSLKFKGIPELERNKIESGELILTENEYIEIAKNFKRRWEKLEIISQKSKFTPSFISTKREKIIINSIWIDTKPINIKI